MLGRFRRRVTRTATVAALRAAGTLSCSASRSLGVAAGRLAQLALSERLVGNLRAAGVDSSDATVRAYFRRLGLWVGHSLGVYGAGFDASLAIQQVEFDPDMVGRLDAAAARGKGVVLAAPHMFCHELGAALIHRRHPVTAVVRESKDAGWGTIKERWYGAALGLNTILRPRKGSAASEVAAMLRVLRRGGVLGITPDVPTARTSGLPVTLFGRPVHLSPGMVLLAQRSGAPLVTALSRWVPDPRCAGRERLLVGFTEPLELPREGTRDEALHSGLQRWCDLFEAELRRSPADWLFWLDKAWTKVFRTPATVRASARAA